MMVTNHLKTAIGAVSIWFNLCIGRSSCSYLLHFDHPTSGLSLNLPPIKDNGPVSPVFWNHCLLWAVLPVWCSGPFAVGMASCPIMEFAPLTPLHCTFTGILSPPVHALAHHIYSIKQCAKFHFRLYKEASLVIMTSPIWRLHYLYMRPQPWLYCSKQNSVMGIWCPQQCMWYILYNFFCAKSKLEYGLS
jgi:hypothetical protein